MTTASAKEKEKKTEQVKQKGMQPNAEEVVAIESNAESNSDLIIHESAEETSKESAVAEQARPSGSADSSAVPFATGVKTPMEVQSEEGEVEKGAMGELNVPTPESEMAMAELSSPTPTIISIYSTVVSSSHCPFLSKRSMLH